MYFYQKKDYSFRRVAAVLIRLNLLTCLLPYMMRTTYTFYYFAPLASFWFLVVYLTMRIGYHRNESLQFLIGKIITSAVVVTAFIHVKGVLAVVFLALRFTCGISWNVNEWEYRLGLDKYVVYVGMLVAVLYIRISKFMSSQIRPNILTEIHSGYFGTVRAFFTFAALVTLPVFWLPRAAFPTYSTTIRGSHTSLGYQLLPLLCSGTRQDFCAATMQPHLPGSAVIPLKHTRYSIIYGWQEILMDF